MSLFFEVSPEGLPIISSTNAEELSVSAIHQLASQSKALLDALVRAKPHDGCSPFDALFDAVVPRLQEMLQGCFTATFMADDLGRSAEDLLDLAYGEGRWLIGDAFDPPAAPGEPERAPAVPAPDIPVSTTGRKPRARTVEAVPA